MPPSHSKSSNFCSPTLDKFFQKQDSDANTISSFSTVFQLDRQQSKIVWECNNGGIQWGTGSENTTDSSGNSVSASQTDNGTMPSGMCSAGFHSLYIAFVLSLLADFGCQVYAYFMAWRFKKRIEHYTLLATNEKCE